MNAVSFAGMNVPPTCAGTRDAKTFLTETLPGQIHLVAIVPDGTTRGADFGTDAEAALAWAERQAARKKNIYWTVNFVESGVNKKPFKCDMVAVRFAHVDIDPPKDGAPWDVDASMLTLKGFNPPPSCIVSSGNGLQGLWRVGDATLDEVEEINRALISRFGGDPGTGNCDRLLRVPGFVNYPNEKKRKAGRVPVMATLVDPYDGTHYTAAQLYTALGISPSVGAACEAANTEAAHQPPLAKGLFLTTTELGLTADDYLSCLIDKPKGADRSADMFSCACEMARQGHARDTIAAVLLNPANAVSAHPLSQADPHRAVTRAIDGAFKQSDVANRQRQRERNHRSGQASDDVPSAMVYTVKEMLQRFVFIEDGSQVADKDNPQARQSFTDFRNATAASTFKVSKGDDKGFKALRCADDWLRHPERLTAATVTFKAGAGAMAVSPDGRQGLNLWAPYSRPAPPEDWANRAQPFLDHVAWLWGEHADRFLDWLAHVEQRPGELPHFGWVHVSKIHGKGRGWLSSVFALLWPGSVAASFDLIGALNTPFNDRLSRCLLAIVDEINEGGNSSYRHAQTVRQMMTAVHREINVKCGRKHVEHNAARWLLFSNHVGALPIDTGDRRFFVVDHEGPVRGAEHYTALYGHLQDPEFVASVAESLRQRDISNFNPGEIPPLTKAKLALIASGRTEAELVMEEIVQRWPVDVITWREISRLIGEDTPKGPAVKHMTERAGLVKLKPRIRADGYGDPTPTYSIRNHDVWDHVSSGGLRKEISRIAEIDKQKAFFNEEDSVAGDG